MHFNTIKEFLKSFRTFVSENPTAYIKIKDDPRNLRIGFEAILDEGPNQEWTLPISQIKKGTHDLDQNIIKDYFKACVTLNEAEADYVNMFAGTKVR